MKLRDTPSPPTVPVELQLQLKRHMLRNLDDRAARDSKPLAARRYFQCIFG